MEALCHPSRETDPATVSPAPELCVVVPVLNERDNVAPLAEKLRETLAGLRWEVVFVDDGSTDGTRAAVAAIGKDDARVRLLHRVGRKGLSSAFIEGMRSSLAPYVAAMDGDLQHDERILPDMLRELQAGRADIVIGSRYVAGGGLGEWDKTRAGMSDMATRLSRLVLRTQVSDPMSGFFMLTRPVFERAAPRLSAIGFKILLDLIASLPEPPRIIELPYTFRTRVAGESKLDAGVLFDFGLLLLDKLVGSVIPVRFVMFALIGALGLLGHLLVLSLGLSAGLAFSVAQGVATGCAIVGNFVLNNEITFRDRRLKGGRRIRGLLIFTAVCTVGAIANLNVAFLMFNDGHQTWLTAGVVGAAMSLVWNYAVGSTLTWK
ncbi:MAG: glycosyltransferase family 2 protein [Acetobacteraceae bacterium]|nr:glycosyltransferase family 2 protein [Acetobacteraceae bacterium]